MLACADQVRNPQAKELAICLDAAVEDASTLVGFVSAHDLKPCFLVLQLMCAR